MAWTIGTALRLLSRIQLATGDLPGADACLREAWATGNPLGAAPELTGDGRVEREVL